MLPAWTYTPEMLVTYALFILSALVSLFPAEIRQFFTSSGKATATMRINSLERKKLFLQDTHGNAYSLLLYLAWACTNLIQLSIWTIIATMAVKYALKLEWSPFTFVGSLVLGRGMAVATKINMLYDYRNHMAEIEKELASLKGESVSPPVDRNVS